MGDVKLTSPLVSVIREGHETLEVQTDNRDLILWEKTRVKHRWPKFDEAPMTWLTFLAWAAARRTGAIAPDYRWEQWEAETLSVGTVDKDKDDDEGGRPFAVVTEFGSSSSSP
jgi:hypothetical protein